MLTTCPECHSKIYGYNNGEWLDWICWRCGHYESNSPGFKESPYIFKNLVRNNPFHFMKKYAKHSPTQFQQRNKTSVDSTEQNFLSDETRQADKNDESDVNDTEPENVMFKYVSSCSHIKT